MTNPSSEPSDVVTTKRGSIVHQLRDWVILITVALVLSFVIRQYCFQTFYIPSGSMEPTLQIGDRIVVDKLSVDFGTVHTGDIIVFKAPPKVKSECGDADTDLIKRVIGVPGDIVSSKGDTLYIDGVKLAERWPHFEPLGPAVKNVTVPPNDYFVMGDNHGDSCDSRYWGFVPHTNIVGKAFVKIWPLSQIGWL